MENKYLKIKKELKKELDKFIDENIVCAFSNKQFNEGIKKTFNLDSENENHLKQITSIGSGIFILHNKVNLFSELTDKLSREHKNIMLSDDEYALEAFKYELINYEYSYTNDIEPVLDSLELTINEINEDKRLLRIFNEALKFYGYEQNDDTLIEMFVEGSEQ